MNAGVSYGRLVRDGEGWILEGAPAHVAIRLKAVFGHIAKHDPGPFRFAGDPDTCADLDWFRARYPFSMSLADEAALTAGREAMERTRTEAARVFAPDWTPPVIKGLKPVGEPYEAQLQAVDLIQKFGGLLVADDVGEGKTVLSICAMHGEGNLPAVVVCEPHLRDQWVGEIRKWSHLRAAEISDTKGRALPEADVYVASYSNVHGWIDVFAELSAKVGGLGLVVFDEVSELRHGAGEEMGHHGEGARKGKACLSLARMSRRRAGLSATPLYNYGAEMWTIMDYIRPGLLGSRGDFMREWCELGRLKDPAALNAYLIDQFAMVRRSGKRVPVKTSIVTVTAEAGPLDAIADEAAALAEKAATGSFMERGEASRELDLRVRQATGIAKAVGVARYAEMILATGKPVIMAGWHREVYAIWLRELAAYHPRLYTGSETPKTKREAKEAFLAGECRVLMLSLRSGKGLDGLQAVCSTAIIGELDWSPSTHHQVIGRVARQGQAAPFVDAIYPIIDDGSDPPMVEVNGLKASEHMGVLDGGKVPEGREVSGSRMKALVDAYRRVS